MSKASPKQYWKSAALCAALLLAGCGGGPPPTTFDLSAPRDGLTKGRGHGTLVVTEPVALLAYDGDKIVVRASGGVLSILGKAQWADRLPKLVQARIIQSFENAQRFAQVGRPTDRLNPDYFMVSEIRSFEVQEASREAVVEIAVKFVRDTAGTIAGGKVFTARRPVDSIDGAGAAKALDEALTDVLRQIVAYQG